MTCTRMPTVQVSAQALSPWRRLLGIMGLMVLALPVSSFAQNQLEDIEVIALPGQQVQLELKMSGPAPDPLSFTIDDPARISIDLPNTELAMDRRRTTVDIGSLSSVMTAEAQGRTRVVLNMNELVPYETRVVGNSIFVTLGREATMAASSPTFAASADDPRSSAPVVSYSGRAIQDIDFRRSQDGAGQVSVRLSDPNTSVDLRQQGNVVVVEFAGTHLPDELMRRMDVLDFATPINTVDALRVNDNARLVIASHGNFDHVAYQSDNIFTVEITPVIETDEVQLESERVYAGERLTLNFQDIETRAVLQLLADTSGLNIVVSDSVSGNVTLRLQNVPWDQALDLVLRTKGLAMRQNGNVILVAPAEEIAARERAELEAVAELQELERLHSEFIQVNYAKASDLATLISETGGENSMLSVRGSVAIDERTNTLLVQDVADRLDNIRRMVAVLDIPIRQVLIESRIVVVNDDFTRDLGVRFGATYVTDNSSDGIISTTGSSVGSDIITQSAIDNLNNTGTPFPVIVPGIDDRFNVNLPVQNPAGSWALAILDDDYLVDLELSAAQAEGRGEIISTPRVITANQKEASIEQGVEIPFQEASSSGATTTQFKKAVLSLRVTPQITPDDRIIMDLHVNQDSVGENVPSATGGFVPSIDTREVITQVLVNDGETVVLGGIYETETRETVNKVPVLGDIPGLGRLFKQTSDVSNKSELLIFVTPRILREGTNIY